MITERLQILQIPEPLEISLVRNDVIDHIGWCDDSSVKAIATKRFLQQMPQPQLPPCCGLVLPEIFHRNRLFAN